MSASASLRRQEQRALRWRIIEGLRSSVFARSVLGAVRITRGLVERARGNRYGALDHFCSVGRVVRIRPLVGIARGLARRDLERACGPVGQPRSILENDLLREVSSGSVAREHGEWLSTQKGIRRPTLGGDLLILKAPDRSTGERGVILLKYSNSLVRFLCVYDFARVLESYQLVLEPSWVGYEDPVFHLFVNREYPVVVQAHQREDFEYLRDLRSNLLPVSTGSSYWVDEDTFRPLPDVEKKYLAVMVANWLPLKRHEVLLRALARLDSRERVALVGFPFEGFCRDRIDKMIVALGLTDRVDVFEWVSPSELNEIFNRSWANVLLSHKEGGNKAVFEGLFAGVPCVVTDTHVGIRHEDVNAETGIRVRDEELADGLASVRSGSGRFRPRDWAIRNASSAHSTTLVEQALREAASRAGQPFTRAIVAKVNRPFARYKNPGDWEQMLPFYRELERHLRVEAREPAAVAEPWDPLELDRLGEAAS